MEEKRLRILELIENRSSLSTRDISGVIDIDHSGVSRHLSKLEEDGYIEMHEGPEYKVKELTRRGYQALLDEAVDSPRCNTEAGDISLHNFSVRFPLRQTSDLDEGWQERWCQGKVQRSTWDPTNDSYVYWKENWKFRITGEHLIVRLESEIRGDDPVNLKDRALVEIFEARDWIQDQAPIQVESRPKDFRIWVSRQHLAYVQDPFCQLVNQYSDVSLDDVKIYDEDGTERLWLDNSDGEEHLEAGNAPGENRRYAEDDIDFLKTELYEYLIDNKDEWKTLQSLASIVTKGKEGLEDGRPEREPLGGAREQSITDAFNITSRWLHKAGHLMGWAEEIGRPVKLVDAEDLP